MRIRKRYQNPHGAPDLSPPVAPPMTGPLAPGGEGESAAGAATAEVAPSDGCGEKGEGGLHPYRHLLGQSVQGPPSAKGGVRVDLPQWRDMKEEKNGSGLSGGAGVTALKSFRGVSSKVQAGHDKHQRENHGEGLVKEQEEESLLDRESKLMLRPTADYGGSSAPTTIEEEEDLREHTGGGGKGKKRRRPASLMEGSRCSRVNGRGWRCCQQTLVGYSLCEHHLGKGRLRSMNSVRCNGRARKKEAPPPPPPPPHQLVDEEDVLPEKTTKKKIGKVKARSISSLLHQPHLTASTVTRLPVPASSHGVVSASLGYSLDHDNVLA